MDDTQINVLIDSLKDIAENLRRIAFEIEELRSKEEHNEQTGER